MQSANNNEKEDEHGWLADIEDEYMLAIAAQTDYEQQFVVQRDAALRGMWGSFQESATSIAQLYKDRLSTNETGALWLPFQTAAATVTTLYKESTDGIRRSSDTAILSGYQRRTRELADWARKKNRRYIRREELLAYLAGKPPPPFHCPRPPTNAGAHHQHQHHNHHLHTSNGLSNQHPHHHPGHHQQPPSHHNASHHHPHQFQAAAAKLSASRAAAAAAASTAADELANLVGAQQHQQQHQHHQHHHHQHHHQHQHNHEQQLEQLQLGEDGRMADDGAEAAAAAAAAAAEDRGPEQLGTFTEALARRSTTRNPVDLYAFVTDEIARHSKRAASPTDINMDAAQQSVGGKRQRF